jgi:hypothetical protein
MSRALPAQIQDQLTASAASLANASGALHHLSVLDGAKCALLEAGALRHLAAVLRNGGASSPAAWDGALGALWNASLVAGSEGALAAAGAPGFLCTGAQSMCLQLQRSCED